MRQVCRFGRWDRAKKSASVSCAALLFSSGFAGRADAGPVDKVNVRKAGFSYTATITAGTALGAGSAAGNPVCEKFVGGLVIPQGAFLIIDSVKQDNVTALLDLGIIDPNQLIAQALANYVDQDKQEVATFRFHPNNCPTEGTTVVEVVFRVKEGEGESTSQVNLTRFVVGATNNSDFLDGEPLSNFLILDAPIIDVTVPAVSTWGLIALALLLLIGLKTRFRKAPRIAGS